MASTYCVLGTCYVPGSYCVLSTYYVPGPLSRNPGKTGQSSSVPELLLPKHQVEKAKAWSTQSQGSL